MGPFCIKAIFTIVKPGWPLGQDAIVFKVSENENLIDRAKDEWAEQKPGIVGVLAELHVIPEDDFETF